MKKILLIGGGGHCKSVIDVIEEEGIYAIAGIIDKKELAGSDILGYKVIGSDDDLPGLKKKFEHAFITIGQIKSSKLRVKLFNTLKELNFHMPSIVSPRAYVAKGSLIGEGSILMHDALINSNVTIGSNCIINTKALVEHNSTVGDNSHIATGVIINGDVVVDENSFVGSGTVVVQGAKISGFIKAGSLVK